MVSIEIATKKTKQNKKQWNRNIQCTRYKFKALVIRKLTELGERIQEHSEILIRN